jgi:hypothetical protein
MTKSFQAQIDEWVAATKERTTAVFRESCQRLVTEMQKPTARGGNMPVDTGFLRNSLLGSTSSVPQMRDQGTATADQVVLTIASLDLGDTLYVGYTANYARHRHYMNTAKPGGMWRDLAAQRWQTIVNGAARDLQKRVLG